MNPTTPASDQVARTMLAASTCQVTFADGSVASVEIKRLTIRQLYQFAKHLAAMDGPDLVALCTGKPAEWCDNITPESFSALHKAALDLNFIKAAKLAEGDPRLAALILPFIQDVRVVAILGMDATATTPPGVNGPDSLPAPAPSESAAATGSDAST
jgi:hypothetical protein